MEILAGPDLTIDAYLNQPEAYEPHVRAIFAMTANGATAIDGDSGAIGNDFDTKVLLNARVLSDCVLVGSETVRTEDYGGVQVSDEDKKRRAKRKQKPVPPLVVVTHSFNLDPNSKLFTDTETAPILLADAEAISDPDKKDKIDKLKAASAQVHEADTSQPGAIVETLRMLGLERILLEGGPSLFHQFFAADLVDSALVTFAPTFAPLKAEDQDHYEASKFELQRLGVSEDGYLFARYQRTRAQQ